MANEDHFTKLKRGIEHWNAWRNTNKGIRPDLSKEDLSKAQLIGFDLSGANLSGTYLLGAYLNGANLSNADLSGAKFSNAYLSGANLSAANLSCANLSIANLSGANLSGANLSGANLSEADLTRATCSNADFSEADLSRADLSGANLSGASFSDANLIAAELPETNLSEANLTHANLSDAILSDASLIGADFSEANLTGTYLNRANLLGANLSEAILLGAFLSGANLSGVNLTGANLTGANLIGAICLETNFTNANIVNASIFGVSVWNIITEGLEQNNLIITKPGESIITVDNIEIAQFIYLILNNQKLREVIGTIAKKGVLILGRFTPDRKKILDAIRDKLREHDLVPIMFDFEKSDARDFTETIKILAGMSRFVIADITNPKSSPLELQALVPDYKIPFLTIIQKGETPFSMFSDLQKYPWVLETMRYGSETELLEGFEQGILNRALVEDERLREEKQTPPLLILDIKDYKDKKH